MDLVGGEEEEKKTPEIAIADLEKAVKKILHKLSKVENTSSQAQSLSEGTGSRFEKLFNMHDDALLNINR